MKRKPTTFEPADRHMRADAQRNIDSLLPAATRVFKVSGVGAPVRDLAQRACVGVGTSSVTFPQRSDLIAAVFVANSMRVNAACTFASEYSGGDALTRRVHRQAEFIGTKRGLATALHPENTAFAALPDYFDERLRPVLQPMLEAAAAAGEVRADVDPDDLLQAVRHLYMRSEEDGGERTRRIVSLLIDRLHYGMKADNTFRAPANGT